MYKDPAQEIETRAQALTKTINAALKAHYEKAGVKSDKQIHLSVSHGEGSKKRTPEEQAAYVLKGRSWTMNSAHASDGAKHIVVSMGGKATWDLNDVAKQNPAAWTLLVKEWNAAMAKTNLRNHAGGKDFDPKGSDPLHMELPHSRLPDNDPYVIKGLETYFKATRFDGKPKNKAYENTKGSSFQRNWLITADAKLAKEKVAKAKDANPAKAAPKGP